MARTARRSVDRRPMRRLGLALLIALGLGLVAMQTAPQISRLFTPVRLAANDQVAAASGPSLWRRVTGVAARERRIRELEAEVRDLSRWRAASISMVDRLEAYEEILNALGEPPARGVTARIAAETSGPFSETVLANAGRAQGVEPGFIAVNEGGLVGRVIHLGERSSRILLVTDFNSRVPVLGEASGVRAILQGGRDGLGDLADRPELDEFFEGERILTSGEGGLFPRGVVAGIAVKRGRRWRAALAMQSGETGYVRLLPPKLIPTPEEAPPERPLAEVEAGAAPAVEPAETP